MTNIRGPNPIIRKQKSKLQRLKCYEDHLEKKKKGRLMAMQTMLYFPSMIIAQNEWSKSRVHELIIVPNQLMDHLDKKKGTERWKLKMKVHK